MKHLTLNFAVQIDELQYISDPSIVLTIHRWLVENCGIRGIDWDYNMTEDHKPTYYFEQEEFATAFKLRWI